MYIYIVTDNRDYDSNRILAAYKSVVTADLYVQTLLKGKEYDTIFPEDGKSVYEFYPKGAFNYYRIEEIMLQGS